MDTLLHRTCEKADSFIKEENIALTLTDKVNNRDPRY